MPAVILCNTVADVYQHVVNNTTGYGTPYKNADPTTGWWRRWRALLSCFWEDLSVRHIALDVFGEALVAPQGAGSQRYRWLFNPGLLADVGGSDAGFGVLSVSDWFVKQEATLPATCHLLTHDALVIATGPKVHVECRTAQLLACPTNAD